MGVSVFEEMSALARAKGAINLGQGFPDDPGPADVRAKAAEAVVSGWNQYPPMRGLPELRATVAAHYARHQGLTVDPERGVLVTSGATEALAAAIAALVEPGDEVVLFQPCYDAYLPLVVRAGGVPRFVRLAPPDWDFDDDALARAFSSRTKLVVFNDPLNPAAVAYPRASLERLARACVVHDAYALCDEVWEHVLFDGRRHESLLSMPGMAERAIKVGSAGKIFSLTGWKVGFVVAAPALVDAIARAHQFIVFTTPPNLQSAVAYGLGKDDAHFAAMRAGFQRSRDRFVAGLASLGWPALPCAGTYFVNVDVSGSGLDDATFCRRMVEDAGVAAIPVSAFYAQEPVTDVVRFCFAKTDATLDAGLERLAKWRP
ncbi:MAG: aminotransferase [Hyphomicrobiales bacterium]|nr:aminotransferase [Hyphomicrobiales bacterium]MDE2016163.1 aminotransferase [Hyphomicrobiales bacterium]